MIEAGSMKHISKYALIKVSVHNCLVSFLIYTENSVKIRILTTFIPFDSDIALDRKILSIGGIISRFSIWRTNGAQLNFCKSKLHLLFTRTKSALITCTLFRIIPMPADLQILLSSKQTLKFIFPIYLGLKLTRMMAMVKIACACFIVLLS